MKHKYLSLLTLALVGALLFVGCNDTEKTPPDTSTSSTEVTDLPAPEPQVLLKSAVSDEDLSLLTTAKASYQTLLDLIGEPHEEVMNEESYYKLWNIEGDQILLVTCKVKEGTNGATALDFYVDDYEFWSTPLLPMLDQLEMNAPAKLTVSIESERELVTNTVSDASAISDILDKFNGFKSYPYDSLNTDRERPSYWRTYQITLLTQELIPTLSYQLEMYDQENALIGTIDLLVPIDESYAVALRYDDGTDTSEWSITNNTLAEEVIKLLYSGTLPDVVPPPEFEYRNDLIWAGGYVPGDYHNIDAEYISPEAGEIQAPFLVAPGSLGDREDYRFMDPADENAEFAVYFQYVAREDNSSDIYECDWDALVDYLADLGIEEVGREGGFSIPIFAATIAELEELDCNALQAVMGIAEHTDIGLSIMLSYNSEEENQDDPYCRYGLMDPWVERNN